MTTWTRAALCLLLLPLSASPAAGAEAQRVLVVHSFGSMAPPFTTHSTAFEATLTREMGGPIDLDEVSLDMARYAQPDMEEPFASFLRTRLTKWEPDLVVPIGSPAGRFVAKHRSQLFPHAPVIYTGMDRRTLPADAFKHNATFVGESFDLAGLVEDILQLAPDTDNIVVVIGASPLERFWTKEFQRAFAPFENRVTFSWLNDLTFDGMLRRVATLPPRSFILLALLLRDAAGVTHNQDDALQRLRAVANAPINGLYRNQLGFGLVGGRLYQAEAQGEQSARIAIRILRGEPASSFPPLIVGTEAPRYDWRELQRWKIGEDRLPPGSVVAFREPTLWERHRWWIVAIASVALVQAGLIGLLGVTLAKRRRSERALRESEARLHLAAESSGAALWSLDLQTQRVWATPRLHELFQFSSVEPLTYETFLSVVHPADRSGVRRAFEASIPGPPGIVLEFRIVRPDGTERWIATRGLRTDDPRSTAKRWSGASMDITERKRADELLRESESRFRAVADSAPVLIWMSGVDKLCTFFNKPWLDFTGRTAEQEHGDGWVAGVHPDDVEDCLHTYSACFDARIPFVIQYRLRRHDGEYRWILDHGVPRYDAQDTFTGYIGSCSDITERVRAEDRLRDVFEAAPNAMIMVNEHGLIAMVNAQVERVFGYRREDILGRPVETLIPERFHPHHQHQRSRFAVAPTTRAMGAGRSLFGRRRNGSEIPVEVGLSPIETSDGRFVVASVIDISERRRVEAETESLRQELAHMSRVATMGELTAAIIHELGQPLTSILSNAQAGLRVIRSGRSQDGLDVGDIFEDIVAADRRAAQVIAQLRSLFRKGEVERKPLEINALIHEVVSVLANDARLRDVSVVLHLDPRLPPVRGDRIQLQQVLLNLVVNAFDAMSDVTDGARQVTLVTQSVGPSHVQVDVADTGPGIAPDALSSIFEPFLSTKRSGMGMGLSVSRSIVRSHEGRLWAENLPARGAIFHLVLPAVPADAVD